ncbi:MAG: hypothetical protein LBI12_03270, partial [Treponema sp.]|nr:hypothetical protein [Treponema sp.]
MAKYAPKLTIFIIFAFFGLFTALTPAFGRGRQDQELIRVDQLINEREHDEALLILTDYIRRNPDNFELAQQRIQRIAAIRDEFNKTADELIYVLMYDPDNSER